jgi:predicted LPLAT superfamily acyltransferase
VTDAWLERPEGGSGLAMRLLVGVALGLGRKVARVVLVPITAYFMIRRGPERRASRAYLTRVLGRIPTWFEVARHFHTFAGVTLDRVYFLGKRMWRFDMRLIGLEELHNAMDLGRGVLLIGAHVGSFDALRAASTQRPDVTVRVVLDAAHSPALSAILKQLNPQMAAGIIDPRKDGTTVALEIGAALNQGALVTMLADRGRPGNATASVDFLGQPAEFPTAPWQIAAALHVPIVLCVGLYRGGNRYDLHFEMLTEQLQVDRKQRQQQLREVVQDFANRLAALLRVAPYNWFNFYDFWNDRTIGNDRPHAGGSPAARG